MRPGALFVLALAACTASSPVDRLPSDPALARPLAAEAIQALELPPELVRVLPAGPKTPLFGLYEADELAGFGFDVSADTAALHVHGLQRVAAREDSAHVLVWSTFAEDPERRLVMVLTRSPDPARLLELAGVSDEVVSTSTLAHLLRRDARVSVLLASPQGVLLEVGEFDEALVDDLRVLAPYGREPDPEHLMAMVEEGAVWFGP